MNIDAFKLPADVIARSVGRDERRIMIRGVAVLCTVVNGAVTTWVPEMPDDIASIDLPLLVLTMDQGGVGLAGMYFAMNYLKLMLCARWDKYHRGVNDIKLACQHTHRGLFRRVMLLTTYVFNLNYGPFGKGAFFEEKKAMMAFFLLTQSSGSAIFRKYAPLYAAALGMSLQTEDDFDQLFSTLPDLPSFNSKGPLVKMMRWFAWWTNFDFQEHEERGGGIVRAEFWATKMIFEHHLTGDSGETFQNDLASILRDVEMSPQEQLRRLKSAQGGFKLAHRIMTAELYANARVLYRIGVPAWTEHCWRVEHIKTPSDGLTLDIALSDGMWKEEVFKIIGSTFHNEGNLRYWGVLGCTPEDADAELVCGNAAMLGIHLASNRSWSSIIDYTIPPLRYAAILDPTPSVRRRCGTVISNDWKLLLRIEDIG